MFDHFWRLVLSPLNTNVTKWSNTLKKFVGKLPTNCLSVFDHFVGLALKGLKGYALSKKHKIEGLLKVIPNNMQDKPLNVLKLASETVSR